MSSQIYKGVQEQREAPGRIKKGAAMAKVVQKAAKAVMRKLEQQPRLSSSARTARQRRLLEIEEAKQRARRHARRRDRSQRSLAELLEIARLS